MNIFKSIIQSIKLKLYLRIAKRNLQIIQYFEKQKDILNEIMTTYKVENKLVELKAPNYKYYKVWKSFSMQDILDNEVKFDDIPEYETIHEIPTLVNVTEEGYYCIVSQSIEYYGKFNNAKFPLEKLAAGLPYKQLIDSDDDTEDGYYEKITTTKKYYHATKKFLNIEIDFNVLSNEEKEKIKLIKDLSVVEEPGYYKIIV